MNTCPVCITQTHKKPRLGVDVDYCMICGIFYMDFGKHRPQIYKDAEFRLKHPDKIMRYQ